MPNYHTRYSEQSNVDMLLEAARPTGQYDGAYDLFSDHISTSGVAPLINRLGVGTARHLGRSAALVMACTMIPTAQEKAAIAFGAAVDDVGKGNQSVRALTELDRELTPRERQTVAGHPVLGAEALKEACADWENTELKHIGVLSARYHHTRQADLPDEVARMSVFDNPFGQDVLPLVQIADVVDAATDLSRAYIKRGLCGYPSRPLGVKVTANGIVVVKDVIIDTIKAAMGVDAGFKVRGAAFEDIAAGLLDIRTISVPDGFMIVPSVQDYRLAQVGTEAAS